MAEEKQEQELLNIVENLQLGRPMRYLHNEARPDVQFAVVINLSRCTGCQSCALACKSTWTFSRGQEHMWWANVETKPFGGHPQHWDVKTLALLDAAETTKVFDRQAGTYKQVADFKTREVGRTVFEAAQYAIRRGEKVLGYLPPDEEWRYPNCYENVGAGPVPQPQPAQSAPAVPPAGEAPAPVASQEGWFFYLPRTCNHCTYPACLAACPRNAIYKRRADAEGNPSDGLVLIDQRRCRGYRKCVEACPYKKAIYRSTTRKSESCIGCFPKVEQGEVSVCVAACPNRARLQGWVTDPKGPVHYLVRQEKIALPLYPQFGTEPNVYYIPPGHVPPAFLAQMFSNYDVEAIQAALGKYAQPSPTTLGVLQLFGVTDRIIASYQSEGKTIQAYGKKGELLATVSL